MEGKHRGASTPSTVLFHLVGETKGAAEGRRWPALAEVNAPSSKRRRIRLLADDARRTRTTLSKARRDARAHAREIRHEIFAEDGGGFGVDGGKDGKKFVCVDR